MHIDQFLARLEGVRSTPAGWRAFCPAHQQPPHQPSRGRTLSVAEGDNGGILIHCHAGCTAQEVVSAVGLDLADLFPESHSCTSLGAAPPAPGKKFHKGWDWWSIASEIDAIQEAMMLLALEIRQADQEGDMPAVKEGIAQAIVTLGDFADRIRRGREVPKAKPRQAGLGF